MKKKITSLVLALVMLACTLTTGVYSFAGDVVSISKSNELAGFLASDNKGEMTKSLYLSSTGITGNASLDGKGYTLESTSSGNDAVLYQNEWVRSDFSNVTIKGITKPDVGIWLGSGEMSFSNSTIEGFNITSGRFSAIGMVGSTKLTLNNTTMQSNSTYDILAYDTSEICINEGTELDSVHLGSQFVSINIGDNWSGSFEITLDYPVARAIGTVGENADVSGITFTNEGYYAKMITEFFESENPLKRR